MCTCSLRTGRTQTHTHAHSIVPGHRSNARQGWTKEPVRCITPPEILADWAANYTAGAGGGGPNGKRAGGPKHRRPHVLKVDVEGHDYQVLMGFFLDSTPVADLPLMVEFEAKSIEKQFPEVKDRMERM
jgi:Methyltransferase FkbM domain